MRTVVDSTQQSTRDIQGRCPKLVLLWGGREESGALLTEERATRFGGFDTVLCADADTTVLADANGRLIAKACATRMLLMAVVAVHRKLISRRRGKKSV